MQSVSDKYIESMKQPFRNRAYIRGSIGIINSDAQNVASLSADNDLAIFSAVDSIFSYGQKRIYATAEQDFSKVDGSMYFLPTSDSAAIYKNGVVTRLINQQIKISLGNSLFDIKGFTIDFGDNYPSKFKITCGNIEKEYENNSDIFVTEDLFEGINEIVITPLSMKYGNNRLRIYSLYMGVVKRFDNTNTLSCTVTDATSPISETLPSRDVSLTLDNQDDYFDAENLKSASAFLNVGQEVKIEFGYDVDGNGTIEWLPEIVSYLKSWKSNDIQIEFQCTDYIDSLSNNYSRGIYTKNGISLYELATDVLEDAGISKERYALDDYLKMVSVVNPMPVVRHTEALQIIANAGRCSIFEDRSGRINIVPAFMPKKSITTNGETLYSKSYNILTDDDKDAYAISSYGFSNIDGSMIFLDEDNIKNTGYVSSQIADGKGEFEANPVIVFSSESEFRAYNFAIRFRSAKPKQFTLTTFLKENLIDAITVDLVEEQEQYYGSISTTIFRRINTETGAFQNVFPAPGISGYNYGTGYIEITDDVKSITFENHESASYLNICFYDKDKKLVSGHSNIQRLVHTRTENDKYFAYSFYATSSNYRPSIKKVVDAPYAEDLYKLEKDFGYIDKAEIEFTKGCSNGRVAVDYLMVGDPASYLIRRMDLSNYPECTLENKAHKVSVIKTIYTESSEENKELLKETIIVSENNQEVELYLSNASYDFDVTTSNSAVSANIVGWGNYYVKIRFSGVTKSTELEVSVTGKEYEVSKKTDVSNSDDQYVEWENPLISSESEEFGKWIADYYSSVIDYSLEWRGDPRVDANDTFYLEKKDGSTILIQAYENELEFNGRFSGRMKARQVVS